MAQELPKTINLLTPVSRPNDTWSKMYDWIFSLGKYLLVGVQLVVLGVFFSRFWIDKTNNDLTEQINEQVGILNLPLLKQSEIRYNNYHTLLEDIGNISNKQLINSTILGSVVETIPSEILLERITFNVDSVNMTLSAPSLAAIDKYEDSLSTSPLFKDVFVNLKKTASSSSIEFTVSLKIVRADQDEVEVSNGG
ncbi:MAG: hypothetical protein Fur003_1100 [Candidatus Dojkabacteria bacterium]